MELSSIHILAVGRHPEIMEVIDRLINNQPGWQGRVVTAVTEAIAAFEAAPCQIVLLCGGLSESEENQLTQEISSRNDKVLLIRHYGGGSGLLYGEVLEALDKAGIQLKA